MPDQSRGFPVGDDPWDDPGLDDPRLAVALEEYLGEREAGRQPARDEFLGRHGAIAGMLAECMDGLEIVHSAVHGDGAAPGIEAEWGAALPAELGDFRVVREIGRGGMGVVYEAVQISLGRRVALKILPGTSALDPRQRQRFRIESQAAAMLHHEHIVPVFSVGSDHGVEFLAMPLIAGHSLAEVLAYQRLRLGWAPAGDARAVGTEEPLAGPSSDPEGLGAPAGSRPYFRAVARLGLQAAQALDHAHALGVLHRDIKPSNLLVSGSIHLWVTDFGLARILDDPGPTRTGDVLGTLRYASPEQVRGDRDAVDGRTDLYALGVTLYELLTLRPAFDSPGREELLHRILASDAIPPRRLEPAIPRDLETIVLKAMSPEPSRRYASAGEMADDLGRYLEGRPIRARRPGPVERAAMWGRRHRPLVATTAGVLAAALVVGSALLWQAKNKTDAALASVRESKRETDAALETLRAARVRERLAFESTFVAMDATTQARVAADRLSGRPPDGAGRRAYADLIAFYDRIVGLFAANEDQGEIAAKASRRAGLCRTILRDPAADRDYRRAVARYLAMAARWPDRIWYRTEAIDALREYARQLDGLGRPSDAEATLREALGIAEGLLDVADARQPCFRMALVDQFDGLARSVLDPKRSRPGDPALALRLALWAVDGDPARGSFRTTLALAHYRSGDPSAATESLEQAIRLQDGDEAEEWVGTSPARHLRIRPGTPPTGPDRGRTWVYAHAAPEPLSPGCRRLLGEVESLLVQAGPTSP